MKLAKTSRALGLAAIAAIASPFATANDLTSDTGWYVGANIGQSRATIDNARIASDLARGGLTATSINDNERDIGFKLLGGYQMDKNFSLEGGYFDLGKFGYTANTTPAGTMNGEIKVRGLNLDLVGFLPITEKFSVFGRGGLIYAEAKDSFRGTGAVFVSDPNPSKRELNYKLGLGLQYAFNESVAMRGEVERYRINDAVGYKGDVDLLSVGLVYRFGTKTPTPAPAPVARVEAPIVVAAAPVPPPALAPEPVIAAPPPPQVVQLKKVTFSADSLFEFNKATIKSAGRQDLDTFAKELKGIGYHVISVTGHSDRIGSHAYNMKLSKHRADAVKAYLVDSTGLPADKIVTEGVDGLSPVTKPGECKGNKATKKLIACLQPDRRVDVEVSGTK